MSRADVQRVLDRAARRLLEERLEREPTGTAAGVNRDPHRTPDHLSALVEGELVPIGARDDHRRPEAA